MGDIVAKRGDLVVVETHHRDWINGEGVREYDEFTVGVVTSVTRDGQVRMYRRAGSFDQGTDWRGKPDRGEELRPGTFTRVYVTSTADIDVTGALATAACHVWVTDQAHEDQPRAYGSLDEVRDSVKPHVKTGWKWNLLRDAGEAWEAARRETRPMLTAAYKVVCTDRAKFRELSDAYHAAVTAANEAYRATYRKVSAELVSA